MDGASPKWHYCLQPDDYSVDEFKMLHLQVAVRGSCWMKSRMSLHCRDGDDGMLIHLDLEMDLWCCSWILIWSSDLDQNIWITGSRSYDLDHGIWITGSGSEEIQQQVGADRCRETAESRPPDSRDSLLQTLRFFWKTVSRGRRHCAEWNPAWWVSMSADSSHVSVWFLS